MNEWNNKYNPFNSMKALMYPDHLEGYAKEIYLPPVTVAIDPSNRCNLKCKWCNASKIMNNDKAVITSKEAKKLVRFLSEWGVKGNCIAGGGEPLTNKDGFNTLLEECYNHGISNSVVSNGVLLDDHTINNIVRTCRWIGISVDAGIKETFKKIKGVNCFDKVVENIKKLRKHTDELDTKCDIGYKFLLHPDNANEIYDACKLAKEIGAHDFQIRPCAIKGETLKYDTEFVNRQIEKALELEDKNFRVYAVRHKVNDDFSYTFDFEHCRACAIHPVFSADGSLGLCIDRRGEMILCNWKTGNVLEYWNSYKHKYILNSVKFVDCPKCTFNEYNKIINEVFVKDKMCRRHL